MLATLMPQRLVLLVHMCAKACCKFKALRCRSLAITGLQVPLALALSVISSAPWLTHGGGAPKAQGAGFQGYGRARFCAISPVEVQALTAAKQGAEQRKCKRETNAVQLGTKYLKQWATQHPQNMGSDNNTA